MGILTEWVVTVAGMAVLMNVCEILMPEGEMNKYVKGILSIICMIVIVSPLPKLFDRSIDVSALLFGNSVDVDPDYEFLDYVNRSKADALASDWTKAVETAGFPTFEFSVRIEKSGTAFVIEAVELRCDEQTKPYAAQVISFLCKEYDLKEEIFIIHVNSTE